MTIALNLETHPLKTYFNKLSILFLGLGLGILSQHFPQLKKTAEKGLVQLEVYIDQVIA